ncbi:hypothetical protein H8B13_00550 [Hymenobacter sp. BT188]|uniref:hypothetical protein n=1 Tax=Hymenobacter sp. BT188 TaxID=2763504 RepID=UPI0016515907|nr:hypothetical protein [Hymenobacter sp. BT188]MBC6605297.1 hypothetical protein [Hymenobacter sp. BT188]
MRLFYSFVFAVLVLSAGACTRSQSPSEKTPPTAVAPPVTVPVAVDLPSLVGYSIEEVRQHLGAPRETQVEPPAAQPKLRKTRSLRIKDEGWINTFEKSGVTLIVTFNARTRKVRDIVMTGNNEEELMQRGNLILTAPSYIVLPVFAPEAATELLGVRVIKRR